VTNYNVNKSLFLDYLLLRSFHKIALLAHLKRLMEQEVPEIAHFPEVAFAALLDLDTEC